MAHVRTDGIIARCGPKSCAAGTGPWGGDAWGGRPVTRERPVSGLASAVRANNSVKAMQAAAEKSEFSQYLSSQGEATSNLGELLQQEINNKNNQ